MTNHAPYLLAAPYLPLTAQVTFGDWVIGPAGSFEGRWRDGAFEKRAKEFVATIRDATGKQIKLPALIGSFDRGIDGSFPGEAKLNAMQLALQFGVLDANPAWSAETDGWWVATSDNADVWAQPIDIGSGRIAIGRGSLVAVTSGGWKTDDPKTEIRAPLEMHLPLQARLLGDVTNAIYNVTAGKHDLTDARLARRISTAVRWLAKAWRNSPSIGFEDRIVMLRIAFEALVGTSDAGAAIAALEGIFGAIRSLGAKSGDTEHLLWTPEERKDRPFEYINRKGNATSIEVSDLGHWYSTFGSARHQTVHEGKVPGMSYEESGSRYNGVLFHTGERLLREAIRAALIPFGYEDLWLDAGTRVLTRAAAAIEPAANARSSAEG